LAEYRKEASIAVTVAVVVALALASVAIYSFPSGPGTSSASSTTKHNSGLLIRAILLDNTTFAVSSSLDCVAGHYSVNFSTPESTLAGGFSAGPPGVTAYIATSQQANTTFQGHPTTYVYSTGLVNSSQFSVLLSPGSYVVWIEGADLNCGSSVVMPLEMLTQVNITQAFTLTPTATNGVVEG
jgi:hypothetical protein